jgi:glutamate dehydrogenase
MMHLLCTSATELVLTEMSDLLVRPTLSYQRLQNTQPLSDGELYDKIRRTVPNKQDLQVLESFLIFNKCVGHPASFSEELC